MTIKITDREGVIPVETMRSHFEAAITSTPVLAKNTPLGVMEINGKFSHYVAPDTDTMWIGFALGMRCAERADRLWLTADRRLSPSSCSHSSEPI